MATVPQSITRNAPRRRGAPPRRAAAAPRIASIASVLAPTAASSQGIGANHARSTGGSADREGRGGRQRGLQRACARKVGHAELVTGVGTERIVRRELIGHVARQRGREPARHIDGGQFIALEVRRGRELGAFARQIGGLGVRLRADGHVFTRRHRQCAATRPAIPAMSTGSRATFAAATPTIRLLVEMRPSFAPSTAARSHAVLPER
jgi:hypothetical protein